MNEQQANYVIVGAGHAGGRAAEALVSLGLGAQVVVLGEETFAPYERPPVSKELLAGSVGVDKLLLRPASWYAENGVRLVLDQRVVGLDTQARKVTLSNGGSLNYGRLLLTTGARPRKLPPTVATARVHVIRGIADTLALRERLRPGLRVTVIGGGFIGLEVAAALNNAGCAVTLLESAPTLLARVGPAALGEHIARLHQAHGVDLRTGVQVRAVREAGSHTAVELADGKIIEADEVVVGIGAEPNTDLAEAAGLRVENGIVTDEHGHTSDSHVFAAGDVTSHFNPLLNRHVRLESWQNAQNQANAVARNMAGVVTRHAEVPWFWTDQYDTNVQFAGVPTSWADCVVRGDPASGRFVLMALEDERLTGVIAVNAGRDMRPLRQLIAKRAQLDRACLADPHCRLEELG